MRRCMLVFCLLLVFTVVVSAKAPAAKAQAARAKTAKKVTLHFKDANLMQVASQLADRAGINLLTARDNAGKITVDLKNVAPLTALKALALVHGYSLILFDKTDKLYLWVSRNRAIAVKTGLRNESGEPAMFGEYRCDGRCGGKCKCKRMGRHFTDSAGGPLARDKDIEVFVNCKDGGRHCRGKCRCHKGHHEGHRWGHHEGHRWGHHEGHHEGRHDGFFEEKCRHFFPDGDDW